MKLFNFIQHYIIRPFLIIVFTALLFSYIGGTIDYQKWSIWLRVLHVIVLLLAFILTEPKKIK